MRGAYQRDRPFYRKNRCPLGLSRNGHMPKSWAAAYWITVNFTRRLSTSRVSREKPSVLFTLGWRFP